jgi:hypothetical protein
MERGGEDGSSGRLTLRFVVGTVELVAERLAMALRVFDERRATCGETLAPPVAPRHVLLGALSSAPAGLQRLLARARPLAVRTSRRAGRSLHALARLPGGKRLEAACHDVVGRTAMQVARWAVVGQQEELAARSLARTALPDLFELAMARLADSPELEELLEEQTEGLAGTAVNVLREQSRGVDRAVQGWASRLLRGSGGSRHPALPRP